MEKPSRYCMLNYDKDLLKVKIQAKLGTPYSVQSLMTSTKNACAWHPETIQLLFKNYSEDKLGTHDTTIEQEDYMKKEQFAQFVIESKIQLTDTKIKEIFIKNARFGKELPFENFLKCLPIIAIEEFKEKQQMLYSSSFDSTISETEKHQIISQFWKTLQRNIKPTLKESQSMLLSTQNIKEEIINVHRQRIGMKYDRKIETEHGRLNARLVKEMDMQQEKSSILNNIYKKPPTQENYMDKMTLKDLGLDYKITDFISPVTEDDDMEVMKKFMIIPEYIAY